MGRYALQRVLQGLLVIIGVVTAVFVVTRVIGDPAKIMLPLTAKDAERRAFDHQLGLDEPIVVQYLNYWQHLLHGDFGQSLMNRQSSLQVALSYLPATLKLVAAGMAIAAIIALVTGVAAALKPGSVLDRSVTFVSLLGLSMPQFWLGLLLIMVFGVTLGWFPVSGQEGAGAIVLPALALALPAAGRISLIVRSSMIDELNKQYIRTAEAKGLASIRTVGVHALRNALGPAVTLLGWEIVRALAGFDVVVEVVFGWTGIGHLAYDSIKNQDFIQLQTIVLLVAVLVVAINIAMDFIYMTIDPRVKVA